MACKTLTMFLNEKKSDTCSKSCIYRQKFMQEGTHNFI